MQEFALQRLFSTFANGLPGLGLVLQRIMIASILMSGAVMHLQGPFQIEPNGLRIFDAAAGLLILLGLWTPAVGASIAGRELWTAITDNYDPWMPLIVASLAASLALIGPGAWSIDAHLFGRREIKSRG